MNVQIFFYAVMFYLYFYYMCTPPQQEYDVMFKWRMSTPDFPQRGTKVRRGK